ncbi:MAG: hypothetical protein MN733_28015 [Nitrososphaera sp.]|nr:hypothetical protein [Nitrososphaera sp.]
MNPYTDTRLAWAAGIVDGEGSIYIQRNRSRFTLRVSVRMCCQATVMRLAEILGGNCITLSRRTNSGKFVYSWGTTGYKAIEVLQKLEPFSVTKLIHIQLAKEYIINQTSGNRYHELMGALNK